MSKDIKTLVSDAQKELEQARRNVGCAWNELERAKLIFTQTNQVKKLKPSV